MLGVFCIRIFDYFACIILYLPIFEGGVLCNVNNIISNILFNPQKLKMDSD